MKGFFNIAAESSCLKRITVCEIYDSSGRLLARESNRCNPLGGQCQRLGTSNAKAEYPSTSSCNWTHAEIRALDSIPRLSFPDLAIVFGHDFPCPDCESALKRAGVKRIAISPKAPGCGLRAEYEFCSERIKQVTVKAGAEPETTTLTATEKTNEN